MARDPYRTAARRELVIRGASTFDFTLWSTWVALVLIVAAIVLARNVLVARLLGAGVLVALLASLFVARSLAQRDRWLVVLDRTVLEVFHRGQPMGRLDVSRGVRLGLGLDEHTSGIVVRAFVTSGEDRIAVGAGPHPGDALNELERFLRARGIDVDVDTSERLAWPPSFPP